MGVLLINLKKFLIVKILIVPLAFGGLEIFFRGCFVTENKCPNENITFWLYTNQTQKNPLKLDVLNLKAENFQPKRKLVIIIHGYTQSKDGDPNTQIRPALLENKNPFVISVDYEPLAKVPCYIQAVDNIHVVARCLGELINTFVDQGIFTMDDIHVIGFSLGGQTAGLTGNFVKDKIKRITALDPAKPLFILAENKNRIDASDAEFVDVIHTDVLERGLLLPTGHVDFYPNGGISQPGCDLQNFTTQGSCNHVRAPEYFAESITTKVGFYGFNCPNWLFYVIGLCRWTNSTPTEIMGYNTPNTAKGVYFLFTNLRPPYARGMNDSLKKGIISRDGFEVDTNIIFNTDNGIR